MQSGLQKNFESFEKSTWKFFGDFFWATQDIVSWISFTYLQRFAFVHTETFYSKLYAKRMQESGSLWIFCGDNSSFFNFFKLFQKKKKNLNWWTRQRYTYRVLQTIQMKLILLCVWTVLNLLLNSNMKY